VQTGGNDKVSNNTERLIFTASSQNVKTTFAAAKNLQ